MVQYSISSTGVQSNVFRNASPVTRVLIFSQISEHRDGAVVLEALARSLQERDARIHHVVFTTYQKSHDGTRNREHFVASKF